jgi:hypothetical protein
MEIKGLYESRRLKGKFDRNMKVNRFSSMCEMGFIILKTRVLGNKCNKTDKYKHMVHIYQDICT